MRSGRRNPFPSARSRIACSGSRGAGRRASRTSSALDGHTIPTILRPVATYSSIPEHYRATSTGTEYFLRMKESFLFPVAGFMSALFIDLLEESIDKRSQVAGSFAHWRKLQHRHRQAIVEVFSKPTLGNLLRQSTVGGGNHAQFDADRFGGADPGPLLLPAGPEAASPAPVWATRRSRRGTTCRRRPPRSTPCESGRHR